MQCCSALYLEFDPPLISPSDPRPLTMIELGSGSGAVGDNFGKTIQPSWRICQRRPSSPASFSLLMHPKIVDKVYSHKCTPISRRLQSDHLLGETSIMRASSHRTSSSKTGHSHT